MQEPSPMRNTIMFKKSHMTRIAAAAMSAVMTVTGIPLNAFAAAEPQTVDSSVQDTAGTGSDTGVAAGSGTSSDSAVLTSEQKEEAYSKSLTRSKYGKLYYDYVAEGNTIPATTLFIGTYLMDARAINASGTEQIETARQQAAATAAGQETINKSISNVIYQKALQSQLTYDQKVRYYRSELADGEWRDIGSASKIGDIMRSARVVPKSELDPLIITCVVGADGIPRDPDGNPINIFDSPNPYEMEEITELKDLQDYFNNGTVTRDSTGSDNYRYWRLYYFFNHDNMYYDRYALSQYWINGEYSELTSGSDGRALEEAWDDAEVRNNIPEGDDHRNFKTMVRNWPNVRDSVTDNADRGLDTTYKLFLKLQQNEDTKEEAKKALEISEALDAERRWEVFYNLTQNRNIMLGSQVKQLDHDMEDSSARLAAIQAEIDRINEVVIPDLQSKHEELAKELAVNEESLSIENSMEFDGTREVTTVRYMINGTEVDPDSVTGLSRQYIRLDGYRQARYKAEYDLEELEAANQTSAAAVAAYGHLADIYATMVNTIPTLNKQIAYGEQQISRLTGERAELDALLQISKDAERFTLEKSLSERIANAEASLTAFQDAVKEANTQLGEAKDALTASGLALQSDRATLEAAATDAEEAAVRDMLFESMDNMDGLSTNSFDDASVQAWKDWGSNLDAVQASAQSLYEKKTGAINAKKALIEQLDNAISEVNESIASRRASLEADLKANEDTVAADQRRISTLENQMRYINEAYEAMSREKDALDAGKSAAAKAEQAAAELAVLKLEEAVLEGDQETLQSELSVLESEEQGLVADKDELDTEREDLKNELAELNSAKAALDEGRAAMETRLQAIPQEIDSLNNEKAGRATSIYDEDVILKNLNAEKQQNEALLTRLKNELIRNARNEDFEVWKEELEKMQPSEMKAHVNKLKGRALESYSSLIDLIEKIESEKSGLQGNTWEDADNRKRLNSQLSICGNRASRAAELGSGVLAEPGSEEQSILDQTAEVETKISELDSSVTERRQMIAQELAEWNELQDAKISALNSEAEQLQSDIEQNRTDTAAEEAQITAKEGEITAKEAEITAKEAEITAKRSEVTARNNAITAKQQEIINKQREIATKNTEYNRLQNATEVTVANGNVAIGPTLEFLKQLSETGYSDEGRIFSEMSAYRGTDYEEDTALTSAINAGIASSAASLISYRDKAINRGEEVYENVRYEYSRKVIDAGIDDAEALPSLQIMIDLDNIYYDEDVVHKERELDVIDTILMPLCIGRLVQVQQSKNELSDYDLNRDIEEYQSYIYARTERDTVRNSITDVNQRIKYARAVKNYAKDWAVARLDEHIDWLYRLLATLNLDDDDTDKDFSDLDAEILKLKEEQQKKLDEDDPKEAKKILTLLTAKEEEKNEKLDTDLDPDLPLPDLLNNIKKLGGKDAVEPYLKERLLSDIDNDPDSVKDDLPPLEAIGSNLGDIVDGLDNTGLPDDIKNEIKKADENSRKSPLFGYDGKLPGTSDSDRGSGDNAGDSTSGNTGSGGDGGSGSSNSADGSGLKGGVGIDRKGLDGSRISDAISDTMGSTDTSGMSDADLAALLAALAEYGRLYGDDAVLGYAYALLEEILGKGGAKGFIYKQYLADTSVEYVSFGSIDMTRSHSHYRYTHRDQAAILQQVLGGSASYSFQVGSDTMRDNYGKDHMLSKGITEQADSYLHGNTDTLYPYLTEEDSMQYFNIGCVYMPGRDWAILVTPDIQSKMQELMDKLTTAAKALEQAGLS